MPTTLARGQSLSIAQECAVTVRVDQYLLSHRAHFVDQLMSWVRIGSVAGDPAHAIDVTRSAHWLAATLREIGFPVVEVWKGDDAPAVYAEWCSAPDAPTVLVYNHHDVQAAEDGEWEQTPPFEPQLRDGRVHGRGASDAKGQVLAHIWGLRAHLAAAGRTAPEINLKMLVEGEEETGSAGLARLLRDNRDRVAADLVLFSDTLLWRADHPAVCVSIRGIVRARVEVRGPLRNVHSGAVSGPTPNPVIELCRLLARMHNDKGRIALPGFYDTVTEPSGPTRADLAALPFAEDDWLIRSQTRSIGGEVGYPVLERLWVRPAAEVLTIIGGDPDGPSRGAVPAVAAADLAIRTVPHQTSADVARQIRRWVAENISDKVDYTLTVFEETAREPYVTPAGHPAVEALSAAMHQGFGAPVGRMGNAGTGPAELLARTLDAVVLFFGTGLLEDRWHGSDESASVDVLLAGAATLAHLWPRLAALGPGFIRGVGTGGGAA